MTSIVSIIRDEIAPEKTYKHIIADLQHWPIVQLARDRKAVVAATRAAAVQRIKEMVGQRLSEEIALVIYQEGIRRRTDPWKIDLPDEDTFWKRTRRTLLRRSLDKDATTEGEAVALVGFGTFAVKERAARAGRNPRTGETIEIAATRVPGFKAGKGLKDAVN